VKRLAVAALTAWLLAGPAAAAGEPAVEPAGDASLVEAAVASYSRALDTAERDARLEEFRRAERLFRRAVETAPGNAALYTDLGNAALQAEHLGTAVLAYRRALAIDPDHPRAVQNLDHARTLLPEWVPKPTHHGLIDTFFAWHQTLARSDRELAAAAAFALAALLIAAAIRFRQPTLRTTALVPALVWLALLASLFVESSSGAADAAVVTADEVVARAADSALAPSALPAPLPGGTEVRILEARPPWLRVRLANGRDAWLAESAVTPVSRSR
jgi:tetratricopeptide (TPR) repeat protein